MKLDQKDLQILKHLQQDSKMTNKEISNKLKLSVTAVFERIKRLERERVISRYVALVSPDKVEKNFMVFCQIKLIQHSRSYLTKFESEVTKLTEVLECYHVSGEYDYILKVIVKDMEAYREFMVTKLTNLDHIGSTQSTFIISPVKSTTAVPL
ncbi:AsnC family transcriptional regulator [Salegentibacter salinarum]|uniref:AsnC family transcriptional regulator n=1 Tax=Salegentibacter salinarum TaxID=447422 RepID=A0A2N0U1U2_9FLAO|nr:Lrp/AsnC family transcriptional regulator [Salegentibacter salinarum]PKD20970.1 AsnC family transcriptional regulator [Salegentibacter salinarum]SKB79620.1 Lrp/AsnC family transcriptional regulator, leucine-responsive regulatory protein [Salegentibacter salinarum]